MVIAINQSINQSNLAQKQFNVNKKFAMTLAEILITLGIIGFVAAMVIPTLMHDINDNELKTAFRKAYSVASQAWMLAQAEDGPFTAKGGYTGCIFKDGTSVEPNAVDGRANAFKSKMKVIKTCINANGCWPTDYETKNTDLVDVGGGNGTYKPTNFSWISDDGMCWGFPAYGVDEAYLVVDTNCKKGPNKIAKDIFSMLLGADGIIYFVIDDKATTGGPVSKGSACPIYSDPTTINGRSVSFKNLLLN